MSCTAHSCSAPWARVCMTTISVHFICALHPCTPSVHSIRARGAAGSGQVCRRGQTGAWVGVGRHSQGVGYPTGPVGGHPAICTGRRRHAWDPLMPHVFPPPPCRHAWDPPGKCDDSVPAQTIMHHTHYMWLPPQQSCITHATCGYDLNNHACGYHLNTLP